ncbi:MAG: Vgb family protein [Planctomycetota bacterium]|jgi:DNA-binding beta-propeller fold protein YncE
MRRLSALCLILTACGSSVQVGYARPGYVVRVDEKSGEVRSRRNYDGVIDGMYGFCHGPKGSLYVASYRTGTILNYKNWRFQGVVAKGLPGPTNVLVLPDGDLLVACSGSTQYLLDQSLAGQGSLLRVPLEGEPEPLVTSEHLAIPTALVADANGAIYVGQRNSNKILKLVHGQPLQVAAKVDLPGGPMHLAIAPDGSLYAASAFAPKVVQVDPARVVVSDDDLGQPGGIAFGKNGELYVTSHDRGQIRVYNPTTGRLLRVLAQELAAPWTIQ